MNRPAFSRLIVASLLLAAGCGPGGGEVETQAGKLTGTIHDESGQAISVPGAKYMVSISGVSEKSGENVSFSASVRPDGTYEATLVDGLYHSVRAEIEVVWNANTYRFEMDPVQDNTADRASANGIRQDFVWKVHGAHHRYAQNPDPRTFTNWYGGSVRVSLSGWRNDLSSAPVQPAVGTTYEFTLTPQGTRIDGAAASVVRFERTWTAQGELDNPLLHDLPIAAYELTGEEITAAGTRKPLIFETSYAKFEAKAKVDFPWSEILGDLHVHAFSFDR